MKLEVGNKVKYEDNIEKITDITFKVNAGMIDYCCKHKQKSAYGYKWLYQEEWQLIYDNFKEYLD